MIAWLVLAVYFIAPLVDTIACEECRGFTKSATDRAGFSDPLGFSIAGSKGGTESSTPDQTTRNGECQVCFSAAKIVSTRRGDIVLSWVLVTFDEFPLMPQIFSSFLFKPPEMTA